MQNTVILMVASIVVKLIGALFKVPLVNLYGAEGSGIFEIAYAVYQVLFIVSTAGLPVAVSKMVAESNALGRGREARLIGKIALTTFFCIGLCFTALMLGFSNFIHLLGWASARFSIIVLAPTVFFTCILSAIRGYYQGMANMIPTAISQVIEAVGRLIFGLLLAFGLSKRGYSVEIVVAGAIAGVTLGSLLSCIYIVFVRLRDVRRKKQGELDDGGACQPSGTLRRRLFQLAIPITVGASVLSVTNLIDAFMVVWRLTSAGLMTVPDANYHYGAYTLARNFFNLPQTVVVGIGVSIIPAIAAALAKANRDRALMMTETALRLTGLLAFPCAFGLAIIPENIMLVMYFKQAEDTAVAAPLLTLLGPAVFLVAMVTVTNAVLQAMGKVNAPVKSMAIGAAVKLTVNYILVGLIGIYGAPIGTCCCYGTIMAINLIAIRKEGIRFSVGRVFLRPLLSSAVMGAFVWLIFPPIHSLMGAGMLRNALAVMIVIALAAVIYLLMLLATHALPKEDILMLPKGEKIVKLLHLR
ncbi:MAG: polysaccharide biosynthesis protein [Clostridiaceae bacterium]|nr:polysaccharide biosynthesis protein [Clostridiaceae bacterium]